MSRAIQRHTGILRAATGKKGSGTVQNPSSWANGSPEVGWKDWPTAFKQSFMAKPKQVYSTCLAAFWAGPQANWAKGYHLRRTLTNERCPLRMTLLCSSRATLDLLPLLLLCSWPNWSFQCFGSEIKVLRSILKVLG